LCQETKGSIHPSADRHFGPQARIKLEEQMAGDISPGIEFYFNQFPSFVRYRLPPPLANSVFGCLSQYRMPALHFERLYRSI
jgi:hypothetical protein